MYQMMAEVTQQPTVGRLLPAALSLEECTVTSPISLIVRINEQVYINISIRFYYNAAWRAQIVPLRCSEPTLLSVSSLK